MAYARVCAHICLCVHTHIDTNIFIFCFLCVGMGVNMPQRTHEAQMTTYVSQFSLSTRCVLEIELRSLILVAGTFAY